MQGCNAKILDLYLHYIVFKVQTSYHSFGCQRQPTYDNIFDLMNFKGTFHKIRGGDNEIRTHDPLLARQVLSQLSYTPKN